MITAAQNKKVFIETYGCQMNAYDSELVCSILAKANYALVLGEEEADVEIGGRVTGPELIKVTLHVPGKPELMDSFMETWDFKESDEMPFIHWDYSEVKKNKK